MEAMLILLISYLHDITGKRLVFLSYTHSKQPSPLCNVTYLMRGKITPCGHLHVHFILQGERCPHLQGFAIPHISQVFQRKYFWDRTLLQQHACWCLLYLTWSWWNQKALKRLMTRAGRAIKATVRLNHQSVFVFRCRSIATRTSEANPIYNQP